MREGSVLGSGRGLIAGGKLEYIPLLAAWASEKLGSYDR